MGINRISNGIIGDARAHADGTAIRQTPGYGNDRTRFGRGDAQAGGRDRTVRKVGCGISGDGVISNRTGDTCSPRGPAEPGRDGDNPRRVRGRKRHRRHIGCCGVLNVGVCVVVDDVHGHCPGQPEILGRVFRIGGPGHCPRNCNDPRRFRRGDIDATHVGQGDFPNVSLGGIAEKVERHTARNGLAGVLAAGCLFGRGGRLVCWLGIFHHCRRDRYGNNQAFIRRRNGCLADGTQGTHSSAEVRQGMPVAGGIAWVQGNDRARQIVRIGGQFDSILVNDGDVIRLPLRQTADARAAAVVVYHCLAILERIGVRQVDRVIGAIHDRQRLERHSDRMVRTCRHAGIEVNANPALGVGKRTGQANGRGVDHNHVVCVFVGEAADVLAPAVAIINLLACGEPVVIAKIDGFGIRRTAPGDNRVRVDRRAQAVLLSGGRDRVKRHHRTGQIRGIG